MVTGTYSVTPEVTISTALVVGLAHSVHVVMTTVVLASVVVVESEDETEEVVSEVVETTVLCGVPVAEAPVELVVSEVSEEEEEDVVEVEDSVVGWIKF